MPDIGVRINRAALALFRGERGLPAAVGALSAAADIDVGIFHAAQVKALNVAPELAGKPSAAKYPAVHVYCERVTNEMREKFRRFSGTVRMVAEARVSQSHMDGIERKSQLLADAVTEVLDGARGDWGNGMFYGGGYEIVFGAVKEGGKNYLQATKVSFEVSASAD